MAHDGKRKRDKSPHATQLVKRACIETIDVLYLNFLKYHWTHNRTVYNEIVKALKQGHILSPQLPRKQLAHVFSFLDTGTFILVHTVCRQWMRAGSTLCKAQWASNRDAIVGFRDEIIKKDIEFPPNSRVACYYCFTCKTIRLDASFTDTCSMCNVRCCDRCLQLTQCIGCAGRDVSSSDTYACKPCNRKISKTKDRKCSLCVDKKQAVEVSDGEADKEDEGLAKKTDKFFKKQIAKYGEDIIGDDSEYGSDSDKDDFHRYCESDDNDYVEGGHNQCDESESDNEDSADDSPMEYVDLPPRRRNALKRSNGMPLCID
jgi:hypothetical protein